MHSVIVTGGNRGLGLGIARKLAAEGYKVIAVARKQSEQLTAAMRETEALKRGCIHFIPLDLAKIEEIGPFVKKLRKEFGPIHGLVNNAGMSFDGALSLMHNSQIEQLVRLNTISPIVLTKYVVRTMMADGGGRIVNIASIVGFTGYSGLSVYSATKASLIGFTRSLAREVGRMKVNVNSVAPGFVDTEMTNGMKDEQRQQIMRRSSLKKLTEIEDVANAVEFLLGCKSKSITGTVMTVDAGSTA
jgi:3-oxoacyl-[acyl-carrier protein] reductase